MSDYGPSFTRGFAGRGQPLKMVEISLVNG